MTDLIHLTIKKRMDENEFIHSFSLIQSCMYFTL